MRHEQQAPFQGPEQDASNVFTWSYIFTKLAKVRNFKDSWLRMSSLPTLPPPCNTQILCFMQGVIDWCGHFTFHTFCIIFLSFFFFFVFLWPHLRHTEVLRLGVESELQLLCVTYTTAHSNAGSLTHWSPGTEPASSWILVGFLIHLATTGIPSILFLDALKNSLSFRT